MAIEGRLKELGFVSSFFSVKYLIDFSIFSHHTAFISKQIDSQLFRSVLILHFLESLTSYFYLFCYFLYLVFLLKTFKALNVLMYC